MSSVMIHKVVIPLESDPVVQMPEEAQVLSTQVQHGQICIWYVQDGGPLRDRKFKIFGTGHPVPDPDKLVYVDTVQLDDFVWHIFMCRQEVS